MLRRCVAALLGAAVLVAGWAGDAPVARAAGAWWLPTSWVSAAVGTVAVALDYLNGGTGTAVGDQGGVESVSYATYDGAGLYNQEKVSVRLNSSGLLVWQNDGCRNGSGCTVGVVDGSLVSVDWTGGKLKRYCVDGTSSSSYVTIASGVVTSGITQCASNGGLAKIVYTGGYTSALFYASWTWRVKASTTALVTTVTCRNLSTGVDSEISESATPPSVAPSPVCPAGTVAVRVRVTQGTTVLQDSSITSAALSQYGDYLTNPSGWTWEGDSQTCYLQSSTDPSMVIALVAAVCSEADQGGGLNPTQETQDCGSDIVCAAVQAGASVLAKLLTGIASGITKVVSGIQSVISTIKTVVQSVIDGIRDGVQSIVDKLTDFQNSVQDGFDSLLSLLDPGPDGGGDGSGPGPAPTPSAPSSKVEGKLQPWLNLFDQVGGAFREEQSDCKGPPFHMVLNDRSFTLYLFNACGDRAALASTSRIAITVGLVWVAILSTVRVFSSAVGLQLKGGGD
ncbi:MAG: hypothetical protein QM779_04865 [Propionicimonas sp.]|uniref:hypothetical protein n=1 Tax=Propionicimonas sp. TaxID=1955623 RepID=UPI003D0FE0C9